jgi:hypothetical protein
MSNTNRPLADKVVKQICSVADQKIAEGRSVLMAAKAPRTRLVLSMPADAASRLERLFADGGAAAEELKKEGVLSIEVQR